MKWQERHDIILNWIDSCKTNEQLLNMILFVKKQAFDITNLLFFCRLKAHSLHADTIVLALERLSKNADKSR